MPLILSIVFIAGFQGSRKWGDLYAVFVFGLLGWVMKRLKWPRPPLILGVVLGDIVESNLFISINAIGPFSWLLRPGVIILFGFSLLGIFRPFWRELKATGGISGMVSNLGAPRFDIQTVFYLVYIGFIAWLVMLTRDWMPLSTVVPLIVSYTALGVALISFFNHTFRTTDGGGEGGEETVRKTLHLDSAVGEEDIDRATMLRRAGTFFGWLAGFLGSVAMIGVIPTVPLFVVLYMRVEGREPWRLTVTLAAAAVTFTWFLFEWLLRLPWPPTVVGDWFPVLQDLIPSM
jgi:hypothetical protein